MNGAWVVTVEWPDLVDRQIKQRKFMISDVYVQQFAGRPVVAGRSKDNLDLITVLRLAECEAWADG